MQKSSSGLRGFSLVEALVIVSITGFLALISIPALSSRTAEYRLTRTSREIMANIQLARMKSVSNNFNYKFQFDRTNSPNTYQISGAEVVGPDGVFHTWNDANGNGVHDTHSVYGAPIELMYGNFETAGITTLPTGDAVGTPPNAISITFEPDGTIDTSTTATNYRCIVLQNVGKIAQAVCVQNSGSVRLYKRNQSSWVSIK